MKKLFVLLLFPLCLSPAAAQIQMEHDYPASATVTDLSNSGWKYYLMDVTLNQCRLYHMDHTLWKTINLSVPAGMYLYDVQYVTETLFNADSKVELAYIYYSYDTTLFYYTYYMKIVNEDGAVLLSLPGCAFVDVIPSGTFGTKMLAYVYDYSIVNWTLNTRVYSLPGTLVSAEDLPEGADGDLLPYPNPARRSVIFPLNSLSGGFLDLLNGAGQPVRSYPLNRNGTTLEIPLTGLPAGLYHYRVRNAAGATGRGSFIHE